MSPSWRARWARPQLGSGERMNGLLPFSRLRNTPIANAGIFVPFVSPWLSPLSHSLFLSFR
eukprot:1324300-Amphidinium_carterae.1